MDVLFYLLSLTPLWKRRRWAAWALHSQAEVEVRFPTRPPLTSEGSGSTLTLGKEGVGSLLGLLWRHLSGDVGKVRSGTVEVSQVGGSGLKGECLGIY